jgi:hypothetical protein
MLLLLRAASCIMDEILMRMLGDLFGGFIGSVAVNYLLSAFLLCADE